MKIRVPIPNVDPSNDHADTHVECVVDYDKGGNSPYTGRPYPRGYSLHLSGVRLHDGFCAYTIGPGGNGHIRAAAFFLAPANRLSQYQLAKLSQMFEPHCQRLAELLLAGDREAVRHEVSAIVGAEVH